MFNERNLKTITTLVAAAGLIFGAFKFFKIQEIEAAKPYLEKKLAWCEEAVETASFIANTTEQNKEAETRFAQLYWGVMGLVEKEEITSAMIAFNKAIPTGQDLKLRSLEIAHACRNELAADWSSSWARRIP